MGDFDLQEACFQTMDAALKVVKDGIKNGDMPWLFDSQFARDLMDEQVNKRWNEFAAKVCNSLPASSQGSAAGGAQGKGRRRDAGDLPTPMEVIDDVNSTFDGGGRPDLESLRAIMETGTKVIDAHGRELPPEIVAWMKKWYGDLISDFSEILRKDSEMRELLEKYPAPQFGGLSPTRLDGFHPGFRTPRKSNREGGKVPEVPQSDLYVMIGDEWVPGSNDRVKSILEEAERVAEMVKLTLVARGLAIASGKTHAKFAPAEPVFLTAEGGGGGGGGGGQMCWELWSPDGSRVWKNGQSSTYQEAVEACEAARRDAGGGQCLVYKGR